MGENLLKEIEKGSKMAVMKKKSLPIIFIMEALRLLI